MQDRLQVNFSERARQSEAAKLANLEAFRAVLAPNGQSIGEDDGNTPEMPHIVDTASPDGKVFSGSKPLLRFVPKRVRTPLLAATAGVAALGAAACTSGINTEVPQEPTNQGEVLAEQVTPIPSVSAESTQPSKAEFQQAWDFTLKDKYGIPMSLHDLGDRPIIIEYSQASCPPCRRESNKLSEIMKKYASQGLVVLNVSSEADGSFNPEVPLLLDPNREFAREYVIVKGVPATIFIRGGKVVYKFYDSSEGYTDLDKLSEAFMQGKDLDGILPTATPSPTFTPLPETDSGYETDVGGEAVVDLGTYDFAITKWENLRLGPDGSGRTLVVKGIVRNKTDKPIGLDGSLSTFIEGFDVLPLDKDGNNLTTSWFDTYVPSLCGGVFNEPYQEAQNGNLTSVCSGYNGRTNSVAYMAPGFGLPVALEIGVPDNAEDIQVAFVSRRDGSRQIIRQGQVDSGFDLISDGVQFSTLDQTLHNRIVGTTTETTDLEYKVTGLAHSQGSDVVVFKVASRSGGIKGPFVLFKGYLYLEDGRVIPLESNFNSQISPGQTEFFQLNVGQLPPESAFDTRAPGSISQSLVSEAYDFDLKGSTLVVMVPGADPFFRAWKMPDASNSSGPMVPIDQGGE